MDFGNRDRGVAWISREAKDSIDCAGSFGRADSVNFLVDCSIFVLQLSVRSFTDLRNERNAVTKQRLKELVDKLEIITNGGDNLLTQDDYGDIYAILFDAWEADIHSM